MSCGVLKNHVPAMVTVMVRLPLLLMAGLILCSLHSPFERTGFLIVENMITMRIDPAGS